MPRTLFQERDLPTPFGKVHLADVTVPDRLVFPRDERSQRVVLHGLGADLASALVTKIPFVGDVLGDALEDLHEAELRTMLTEEERLLFDKHNKYLPSSLAAIRTLTKL